MASNNYTKCWMPDQYSQDGSQVPCDPAAPVSPCCTVGESCTVNGYCYGNAGLFYRGACTDKTFRDPACPQQCLGNDNSGGGDTSKTTFLTVCTYHEGGPPEWTCGFDCSTGNFTLGMGAIARKNITGNFTSSPDSTQVAAAATITVTVTAAASGNGSDVKAVGLGVGISLGVALLLSLGCIAFLLRKRHKVSRRNPTTPVGFRDEHHEIRYPQHTELSNQNVRAELYNHR